MFAAWFAASVAPSTAKGAFMTLKSIAAVFAIAVLPLAAQAKDAPKPTKAEAQQVVNIISGDKAKTKAYCEMAKLDDAMDEAESKKDSKKVDELSKQMDALSDQLGPEYAKLMDGQDDMAADSKEAQEIGDVLDGLDKLCSK